MATATKAKTAARTTTATKAKSNGKSNARTKAPTAKQLAALANKLEAAQRRWKEHHESDLDSRDRDSRSLAIADEISEHADALLDAVQRLAGPAPSAVRLPDGRLLASAVDRYRDGDCDVYLSVIEPDRIRAMA